MRIIGQAVFPLGGTIAYFRDTAINEPGLAEAHIQEKWLSGRACN